MYRDMNRLLAAHSVFVLILECTVLSFGSRLGRVSTNVFLHYQEDKEKMRVVDLNDNIK